MHIDEVMKMMMTFIIYKHRFWYPSPAHLGPEEVEYSPGYTRAAFFKCFKAVHAVDPLSLMLRVRVCGGTKD